MTEKSSNTDRPDPPCASNDAAEERRHPDFAKRLTRDVFGRYYWNDRMADEVREALKKRR